MRIRGAGPSALSSAEAAAGSGPQADRPRQGRRSEVGEPGDGRQHLQCGGAARQECGGEERARAQTGVAQGAARRERGVAFAAVGDRGHEGRVGGRPRLVADAEEERRRPEQPDVPRRGGQQQHHAQHPHQHRRRHDRAARAPVQPSAHRGHAHQARRRCPPSWRCRWPARTAAARSSRRAAGRAAAGRCRARPRPGRRHSGGLRRHGRGRGAWILVVAMASTVRSAAGPTASVDEHRQPTPPPATGSAMMKG